jgi:hypothetical protein
LTDSRLSGRVLELEDFSGGLRCDIPSHAIEINELSDICNLDVEIPKQVTTRKGYSRVCQAGAGAKPVRGLYEHFTRDGRKFVVAACDGKLWRLKERTQTWQEIYRDAGSEIFGSNLLSNGTFDTDTSGWTLTNGGTNTAIARDTTSPYAGAGCLAIKTTAPAEMLSDSDFSEYTRGTPPVANDTVWDHWTPYRIYPTNTWMDGGWYGSYYVTAGKSTVAATLGDVLRTPLALSISALDKYQVSCGLNGNWPTGEFSIGAVNFSVTWDVGSGVYINYPTGTILRDRFVSDTTVTDVGVQFAASAMPNTPIGSAIFYSASLTARPRLLDNALSPAITITPANKRKINFYIRRISAGDYSNMHLKVYAKYYSDAGATTLISTVELTEPTTLTTYAPITIQQAANVAPATAIRMRLYVESTGYFDAYDATAAGHGWYIDEITVQEATVVSTPLVVDEKVHPCFVSFLGNLYCFGYDENYKILNGEAIEVAPVYPSSVTMAMVHQDRIWLAGDPANPSNLYFTAYTKGTETNPDYIDPDYFIPFDPDDGDEITGISPCGSGVVIFKRHATFMLTGSTEDDWFKRRVSSDIGCASHRSIVRYQSSVIFLDDNNPGVYMFDGSVNFTLLSRNVGPLIERIVKPEGATSVLRNETYYLFCDDQDSTTPYNDRVLVYSLKTGSWTRYEGINAACILKRKNNDLFFGSSENDGMVHKMLSGESDDGADITSYLVTSDYQFRGAGDEARVRKVNLVAESGATGQVIGISYAVDRSSLMTTSTAMSLAPIGTNRWDTGIYDTAVWEGPQLVTHTFVPAANSANQFRIKLSHTGSIPMKFHGFTILERHRRARI